MKRVADEVLEKAGIADKQKYLIGTMIEIPRAALLADQVAKEAECFSFGANDLTQTTMGLSRDDASVFLRNQPHPQPDATRPSPAREPE